MTRIPKPSISVLFPAFNDPKSIASLVDTAVAVVRKLADEFEVIIVDDSNSCETLATLDQLRVRYQPYVRILTHPGNHGYGERLRSGFAAAQKEFIFYLDGDGQYDAAELPGLLKLMDPDVGLVSGYNLNHDDSWRRAAIGFLYNRFAKWLFGVEIRDVDCNFHLLRRDAVNHANLCSTTETISVELVRLIDLSPWRMIETGVHRYPRLHGRSPFFGVRSLATTLRQLIWLRWRILFRPGGSGKGKTRGITMPNVEPASRLPEAPRNRGDIAAI